MWIGALRCATHDTVGGRPLQQIGCGKPAYPQGGPLCLDALQNVITALGLPFCILLLSMAVSLGRALRADYRGFSVQELAHGQVYPEVEATPQTTDTVEAQHVPETADRG